MTRLTVAAVLLLAVSTGAAVPAPAEPEEQPDMPRPDDVKLAPQSTGGGREPTLAVPGVRRDGARTWIEGVPDLKVGRVPEGAFLRGAQLLLAHRGRHVTLDELRAASGDAFHLCHGTRWELRTGHAAPTDFLMNAAAAYGFEARWTEPHFFWQINGLEPARKQRLAEKHLSEIRSHVDAGRPVLVGGAYGQCAEWRAVVGYDTDDELFCYAGGDEPYTWTEVWDEKARDLGFWDAQARGALREGFVGGWICNAAFLLGEQTREVTETERVKESLRRAVALHDAAPVRGGDGVTYHFGADAYVQWASDLRRLDFPADLQKPRPDVPEVYDMSILIYQAGQVVGGRSAAAGYCERAAGVLPDGGENLAAAARAYRAEAEVTRAAFAPFCGGTEEEQHAWLASEEQREAGVAAVEQMLAQERTAVRHIRQVLATVDAGD